jgi:c-di-AMP phosphodiesterase-like protein
MLAAPLIEPIKEVIQEYNKSKNIIEVERVELKPPSITEVKQKLFKVDVDILDQWNKFIVEHKEFKVQSLISMALDEFIQKYNK